MIRYGISGSPPDCDDGEFLDGLAERGFEAFELGFVRGFPWKERRCSRFGVAAAERGIALSVHAPYFAVLTVDDEDKAKQCVAAIEHTMKLGRALGAPIVCAHFGPTHSHSPEVLMGRIRERLGWIAPKVADLGVGLGLETSGSHSSFGSLGDITTLANEYEFVRPYIDWAHLHAITGGGLTTRDAFSAVIGFLRDQVPGWMLDPLHCQFSDILFNENGEVKHLPYGEGTLRVTPLVEAAVEAELDMVVISESRDQESHGAIGRELRESLAVATPAEKAGRPLGSGRHSFPDPVRVVSDGSDRWRALGTGKPLRLSNIDKPFFPDGTTKGDLVQYYSSVSSVLLPHLAGRPISMSRYPDGIDGQSFYEKRAPGHQPEWMETASVPSDSMGGVIEFLLASDRESLMWFANMGCIEIHPFHSRAHDLAHPDYAIFDFDPAEGSTWDQVVAGTLLLRQALTGLGLQGYPKLSGSRGMHVYVPIERRYSYERVRRFVGAVGKLLEAANPVDLTMEWDKPKRAGKVFIDHNRNATGQTIASVYSVRPRPGAPVSVPLMWDEVGKVANGDVHVGNLWPRLARHGDLWAPVGRGGQTLEAAEAALHLESPST